MRDLLEERLEAVLLITIAALLAVVAFFLYSNGKKLGSIDKNQRALPAFVRIDKLAGLARFRFVQPAPAAAARTSAARDQREWRAPGGGVGGIAARGVLGAARWRLD